MRRCVALGTVLASASLSNAGFESRDAIITDFSHDTPSAPQTQSMLGTSQAVPVNGIVTDLVRNKPTLGPGNPVDLFAWTTWASNSISPATFSQATSALNSTHFGNTKTACSVSM